LTLLYVASIYISGYVIENGIKVEFERLSTIKINDKEKLIGVISHLSNTKNLTDIPLNDLLKLIKNETQNSKVDIDRKISVVLGKKSEHHNINKFLKELNEWKRRINEKPFTPKYYNIEE
jgi:hypothetical protein